jgi:hypoxanthine phosphoribosyltransferase
MDWEHFYALSKEIVRKVIESGYKPDFIVGLARGGWVLSRVLCDFLAIKDIVSLKVEHWGVTATPDGRAQLKYPFEVDLTGRRILVVDDITDTGQSLTVAIEYVKSLNPTDVRSATLRHITGSKVTPDYFGDEISWRWVIFPWNYIEDMCNIVSKAAEDASDPSEISRRIKMNHKVDLDESEISQILEEANRRSKSLE